MKLRLQISKEGDVRFISHLEYARTINRALRRAKLPVAYSEGFNPHIKMSLASALGVGIASLSEYVEVELAQAVEPEEAKELLQANLPAGIRVLDCDVIDKKADRKLMAMLAGASYEIIVPCEDKQQFAAAVAKFNSTDQLAYTKRTAPKKPAKQVDIKEFIPQIVCQEDGKDVKITFDCKITPTGTLKAHDLLKALQQEYGLAFEVMACSVTRTALYKEDKKSLLAN